MRRGAWLGVLLVLAATWAWGCDDREPGRFGGPVAPVVDVPQPPVSTFAHDCARCHGERGSMYAQPPVYRGEALRRKIAQMMHDHAPEPPTDVDIRAMRAYHQAIRADEPFVIITNAGSYLRGQEATLRGEADPDAELVIEGSGRTAKPQRDGSAWAQIDAPDPPLTLTATWRGKTRQIKLSE